MFQHVHPACLYISLETCCFSGCADKGTTEPELRVCTGMGGGWGWQTRSQNSPSPSGQQLNLSFLTQKGWGSLTPHPSLLPSLQFDDNLTAFLLQSSATHKQRWPRLTDKETDQEGTVFLFNTVINQKVSNTISFCFLLFKSIWGTPWSQITF